MPAPQVEENARECEVVKGAASRNAFGRAHAAVDGELLIRHALDCTRPDGRGATTGS